MDKATEGWWWWEHATAQTKRWWSFAPSPESWGDGEEGTPCWVPNRELLVDCCYFSLRHSEDICRICPVTVCVLTANTLFTRLKPTSTFWTDLKFVKREPILLQSSVNIKLQLTEWRDRHKRLWIIQCRNCDSCLNLALCPVFEGVIFIRSHAWNVSYRCKPDVKSDFNMCLARFVSGYCSVHIGVCFWVFAVLDGPWVDQPSTGISHYYKHKCENIYRGPTLLHCAPRTAGCVRGPMFVDEILTRPELSALTGFVTLWHVRSLTSILLTFFFEKLKL